MSLRPAMFRWSQVDVQNDAGELRRVLVMIPHERFGTLCKRQFDLNEDYALGPADNIPGRSRAPLFIGVREAWNNLPAENTEYPHWEHLRAAALIKGAGWAKHEHHVLESPNDARALAKILRKHEEYAIIKWSGNVVDIWVAKSVSSGTPGLTVEKYREIQTMALDWVAALVNTTRADLEANAGRAA